MSDGNIYLSEDHVGRIATAFSGAAEVADSTGSLVRAATAGADIWVGRSADRHRSASARLCSALSSASASFEQAAAALSSLAGEIGSFRSKVAAAAKEVDAASDAYYKVSHSYPAVPDEKEVEAARLRLGSAKLALLYARNDFAERIDVAARAISVWASSALTDAEQRLPVTAVSGPGTATRASAFPGYAHSGIDYTAVLNRRVTVREGFEVGQWLDNPRIDGFEMNTDALPQTVVLPAAALPVSVVVSSNATPEPKPVIYVSADRLAAVADDSKTTVASYMSADRLEREYGPVTVAAAAGAVSVLVPPSAPPVTAVAPPQIPPAPAVAPSPGSTLPPPASPAVSPAPAGPAPAPAQPSTGPAPTPVAQPATPAPSSQVPQPPPASTGPAPAAGTSPADGGQTPVQVEQPVSPAEQPPANVPAQEQPVPAQPAPQPVPASTPAAPQFPAAPATPAVPATPVAQGPSPSSYTVQPGDNLWAVSERTLTAAFGRSPTLSETSSYLSAVIEANKATLPNPSLIHPGEVYTLPPVPVPAS